MRPIAPFAAFALLLPAVSLAAEPAPGVGAGPLVTMADAIRLGLSHAFSARIASFRDASASARVGEAEVAFLPDLTGHLAENASNQTYNHGYFAFQAAGAVPNPDTIYGKQVEGDIGATYVLISSTRRLELKAARFARDSQKGQTEAARRQVVRDVARTYLQVVQSDALLRLAQGDVNRRTRHHEEAEALVKAGKRAEYEVIRADADLAASEATLVDARNNARVARSTLAQVCGASLPADFATQSPAPPEDPRRGNKGSTPEIIGSAVTRRPDVHSAELDADSAQIGVSRATRTYLPTLSLYGRYTKYLATGQGDLFDSSLSYGAQLEVRFSGMLTNAYRERDARAQARLQQVVADQTRVAVSLDVERAMLELDRATEVLAAVQKSHTAAKRNYDTAAERYRLGVASQTEQIDAEASLVSSEVDEAKADVAYRTALWNLRYEMGEPLDVQ